MIFCWYFYIFSSSFIQLNWSQIPIASFQKISLGHFILLSPEIYICLILLITFSLIGGAYFAPVAPRSVQKTNTILIICNLIEYSFIVWLILTISQIYAFGYSSYIVFNAYNLVDFYGTIMKISIGATLLILIHLSKNYIKAHPSPLMEYPVLFLLLSFFLIALISAYNLITIFLAIIGFSLTIYVFLLYDAFNHASREAGIKYFYLSTFSSGLLISGIFFAYLIFHNTNFLLITWQLYNWNWSQMLFFKTMLFHFMIYFITFGFLFKLAAFPCHLWAPEIYDGSPHPITALFILPIKIATLGLFLRLLNYTFNDLYNSWSYIIWFSALLSMFWGCIGALNESRIKRFMAYSSINQMGFLLIGLACGTFESSRATLIYLLLYVIMNLGFFVLFLSTQEKLTLRALTYLTDFNDYAQQNYFYSLTFLIILFSMAGIPPLGGFFGKYYLFVHSFETGQFSLVIMGMVTSVIATYYYLRLIKIMWFEKSIDNRFSFKTILTAPSFSIYIVIEFALIIFVMWSPWLFITSDFLAAVLINPLTTF